MKLSSNLSSKWSVSEFSTFSSMLAWNICRLYCCILGYNLCVMAARECLPQGISRWVQNYFLQWTTCWINFSSFQVCLWSKSYSATTYLKAVSFVYKEIQHFEKAEWDFTERHCQCVDGLHPWAMTVIWPAIESEKSSQCLFLSLWMLLLFASDCQSVTDCDVEASAPAPHWPCHIPLSPIYLSTHPSVRPSIYPSFHVSPTGFQMFVSLPHTALPSTPLRSGRHRNGWFRKGGRVSQSSCCAAPCGAFTVHFCFCAAFMALICWQFRWLSQMLYNHINYTKAVCSIPSKDIFGILSLALSFMFSYSSNNGMITESLFIACWQITGAESFF